MSVEELLAIYEPGLAATFREALTKSACRSYSRASNA